MCCPVRKIVRTLLQSIENHLCEILVSLFISTCVSLVVCFVFFSILH